jgi:hypothetical protein
MFKAAVPLAAILYPPAVTALTVSELPCPEEA